MFNFFIDQPRLFLKHIHIIYLINYNNMENTSYSNTEKIAEEAPCVIEHEELETLIILHL